MAEGPSLSDFLAFSRLRGDDFLSKVDELINWKPIDGRLRQVYRTGFRIDGRPAWDALIMFKILLLQKWYNLSDPSMEESLLYDIRFIRFVGLSIDSEVPDHSTIWRFRQRLREKGLDEVLLDKINRQLERKGVLVRTGAVTDATLIESSRRPRKRLEMEIEPEAENIDADSEGEDQIARYVMSDIDVRYSDDPDADWKVRGKSYTYGYAGHIATDADTGIVLAAQMTPASCSESKMLDRLLEKVDLPEGSRVFADKGFAGEPNREVIRRRRLKNGIMFKAARGRPLRRWEREFNRRVAKMRFVVERTFGNLKLHHGQRRARYVGLGRAEFDLRMACIAYNLKRAVGILTSA
jgi:IS5 family transposase